MTASRLAVALAAVLALAGCDRYAADAPTAVVPGPPAAAPTPMYVKGNTSLRIDESSGYRAQPVEGASYVWSVAGIGAATVSTDNDPRLVQITGTRSGPATVRVQAISAQGRTVSVGSLDLVVR